jgi:acetate kinase
MMADRLGWLGIKLDEKINDFKSQEKIISTPDSKTAYIVVMTNEEYMIAKETYELLN